MVHLLMAVFVAVCGWAFLRRSSFADFHFRGLLLRLGGRQLSLLCGGRRREAPRTSPRSCAEGMESQAAMHARYIMGRLIALPLLHKLIAAAIPVAFILACLIWIPHLPPQEYTSTALLFFDKTAAAKLDPGRLNDHRTQPVELAQSILSDDVVEALCKHFGLYSDSRGAKVPRFRSSLTLSPESTSSRRGTWRGAGRSETT